MDFEKICENRFSVRAFKSDPVEEEKVKKLLKFVRLAPTAKNGQPYEIYVADTAAALEKVKKASPNTFGAPLVFVLCRDENKKWANRYSGENQILQDMGIIATTLLYGAVDLGLGAIYVCNVDPDALKKELGLPENLVVSSIVPVGYIAESCEPSKMHGARREIKEFIHGIE